MVRKTFFILQYPYHPPRYRLATEKRTNKVRISFTWKSRDTNVIDFREKPSSSFVDNRFNWYASGARCTMHRKMIERQPINYDNSRCWTGRFALNAKATLRARAYSDEIESAMHLCVHRGCNVGTADKAGGGRLIKFLLASRPIAGNHLVPPSFSFSLST